MKLELIDDTGTLREAEAIDYLSFSSEDMDHVKDVVYRCKPINCPCMDSYDRAYQLVLCFEENKILRHLL